MILRDWLINRVNDMHLAREAASCVMCYECPLYDRCESMHEGVEACAHEMLRRLDEEIPHE